MPAYIPFTVSSRFLSFLVLRYKMFSCHRGRDVGNREANVLDPSGLVAPPPFFYRLSNSANVTPELHRNLTLDGIDFVNQLV